MNAGVAERMLAQGDQVERMVDAVLSGEETPRRAARRILEELSL